jgi:hypothetical protein
MSDRRRPEAAFDDAELELALRASSVSIAWPTASPAGAPDMATRVRVRLVASDTGTRPAARLGSWRVWRPARRGLVLALAALLVLAAIAGAIGLGLPGLRLTLGEPPLTPPPSASPARSAPPGPLGSQLGLGDPVALADVERLTGRPVRLPTDPAIGTPDAVYVDRFRGNQVALVWAVSEALPATSEPGIGLILMRFDGLTDDGLFEKILGRGVTADPVSVGGDDGFWISGDPHFFFYRTADGTIVDDGRRWVGDTLIWTDGQITYRIESALGRERTIAIAEGLD